MMSQIALILDTTKKHKTNEAAPHETSSVGQAVPPKEPPVFKPSAADVVAAVESLYADEVSIIMIIIIITSSTSIASITSITISMSYSYWSY